MPVVLLRVDERLIHGQVVIGWGHHLRPDRYVLVDDELAQSDWEQELYRLGAGNVDVLFADVETGRASLERWRSGAERTIVMTRDVSTMRALVSGAASPGLEVNLGGIHHGPDRDEVLPYLHLTGDDRDDLRAMAASGTAVSARELPDSAKVGLAGLLKT